MTEIEMKRKIGRTVFRRDVPDGSVKQDALLYVTYTNPYPEFVALEEKRDLPSLSARLPGWGKDGPYRRKSKIPGLQDWHMETFEPDDVGVAPVLGDFTINADRADWMPDLFIWFPLAIVRGRVREFLMDTDPDGSLFWPTRLFVEETGQELAGPFFQWMPKRRLFLDAKFRAPVDRMVDKPFGGPFGAHAEASELTHNSILREFVQRIPLFGIEFTNYPAYNAPMFKALKAERFTGLIERDHDDWLQKDDKNWNIGHFF
ncbi:MAG: hypothetical protein MRY77_13400 [Rhodobacteraceae bacterium]|jgi:hypothetical protein|nr:hypothetical protein [Paracoccaceae bacterium]